MVGKSNKGLWIAAVVCLTVFVSLFGIHLGLFPGLSGRDPSRMLIPGEPLPDRETWMNVLQNDRKIGYSHSVFKNEADYYTLAETLALRVTVMGLTHLVHLHLDAVFNDDLTLRSFESRLKSGQFEFSATGRVEEKALVVITSAEGDAQETRLPLDRKPYLSAGLIYAVCNSGMAPGETMSVSVFDPSSLTNVPVTITVAEKEEIRIMGGVKPATRLTIDFKGVVQQVWVSEDGEVLRESGLMGLSLEKTDKREALMKIGDGAGDLTDLLSIAADVTFEDPGRLDRLKVKIEGIDLDGMSLAGGRQSLSGRILTIHKEPLLEHGRAAEPEGDLEKFLLPEALIQSDDPAIKALAAEIVSADRPTRERAEQLMLWVYHNIKKKPVVSMPNALSTLARREGDCNEHAMLLAALARAAGIPAQVEIGIVYLEGRFYYHAWNRLYTGQWITADAAFGQMPADVTHIRLAGGKPDQQLDLIPVIGNIRLTVMDYAPRR